MQSLLEWMVSLTLSIVMLFYDGSEVGNLTKFTDCVVTLKFHRDNTRTS